MKITVYRPDTGQILGRYIGASAPDSPVFEPGERHIEGSVDDSRYIVDGEAIPRPAMPATLEASAVAVGARTLLASSVPPDATFTLGAAGGIVDDGEIEAIFDEPGEYELTIERFPYLPFKAVIHVG